MQASLFLAYKKCRQEGFGGGRGYSRALGAYGELSRGPGNKALDWEINRWTAEERLLDSVDP